MSDVLELSPDDSVSGSPNVRRRRLEIGLEVAVLVVAFAVVNALCVQFQSRTTLNDGRGFDGVAYYAVADALARGTPVLAPAPFVFRLGTPFLAAIVSPGDLLNGFLIVNLIGNAVAVALLVVWLRFFVRSWWVRALVAILYMAQFHDPVRSVYFNPVLVDSWSHAMTLALLVAGRLARSRGAMGLALFCGLAFVAALFRETTLIVAASFLFVGNPIRRDRSLVDVGRSALRRVPITHVLPLLCSVVGIGVTRLVGTSTEEYSFANVVAILMFRKGIGSYLLAWCVAFGPVLFLLLYDGRRTLLFLCRNQAIFAFLVSCALLGWVGGADTERLLDIGVGGVYVLVALAIERHTLALRKLGIATLLVIAQAVAQRVFWPLANGDVDTAPPMVLLTPLGSNAAFQDTLSYFADPVVGATALAQYGVLFCLLAAWLAALERRTRGT